MNTIADFTAAGHRIVKTALRECYEEPAGLQIMKRTTAA
jgi:hypothetical protein